jgi:hypothetical protein
VRRWPVIVLAAFAAILSFDALRAHALAAGVIPGNAILPRDWLAAMWAATIDVTVAAGLMRIRDDGDWRAWVMLFAGLAATLGFQAVSLERAVPPIALALGVLVLEAPRKPNTDPSSVGDSAPPRTITVSEPTAPAAAPVRAGAPLSTPAPPPAGAAASTIDPAHAAVIAELAASGAGDKKILPALAERGVDIPRAQLRAELRRLRGAPSANGSRP